MDDYRIRVGFLDHPKTMRLMRRLGPEAVCYLLRLFEFVTVTPSRRSGDLSGMDAEGIADACRAQCDPHALCNALEECGWLDGEESAWALHDWEEINPYVASGPERSYNARKAIHVRWVRERKAHKKTEWCMERCLQIAQEMHQDTSEYGSYTGRNTDVYGTYTPSPSPSPSPSPTPSPTPVPDPSPIQKPLSSSLRESDRDRDSIRAVFDYYRQAHPRAHRKPSSKSKEWRAIKARLAEGYTVGDLCHAIDGCHRTPHNIGQNDRNQTYLGLELIMRNSDQVARFIENRERFAKGSEASVKAGLAPKTRRTTEALQRWLETEEKKDATAGQG